MVVRRVQLGQTQTLIISPLILHRPSCPPTRDQQHSVNLNLHSFPSYVLYLVPLLRFQQIYLIRRVPVCGV